MSILPRVPRAAKRKLDDMAMTKASMLNSGCGNDLCQDAGPNTTAYCIFHVLFYSHFSLHTWLGWGLVTKRFCSAHAECVGNGERNGNSHLGHGRNHHSGDDGKESKQLADGRNGSGHDDAHQHRREGLCRLDDVGKCNGARTWS
jgi:hypothetical protein